MKQLIDSFKARAISGNEEINVVIYERLGPDGRPIGGLNIDISPIQPERVDVTADHSQVFCLFDFGKSITFERV